MQKYVKFFTFVLFLFSLNQAFAYPVTCVVDGDCTELPGTCYRGFCVCKVSEPANLCSSDPDCNYAGGYCTDSNLCFCFTAEHVDEISPKPPFDGGTTPDSSQPRDGAVLADSASSSDDAGTNDSGLTFPADAAPIQMTAQPSTAGGSSGCSFLPAPVPMSTIVLLASFLTLFRSKNRR